MSIHPKSCAAWKDNGDYLQPRECDCEVSKITDTDRLNWIMERILINSLSPDGMGALELLEITDDDLTGPGCVTLGEMFRDAINRNMKIDPDAKGMYGNLRHR